MKRVLTPALFCLALATAAAALDREAFTVTQYQLDVQIDRASHVMAVTGRLALRNDSKSSQKYVALQVSSALSWNGIAFNAKPVEWIGNDYTSDIDHTGHLSEAIATLPKDVAPGATVSLDVQYGGAITPDSGRFTRMGVPAEMALRNDWDQISDSFTAIRGLGYVVWYPVSIPAVSMSDGNAVFEAIDNWKSRHKRSELDARITVIAGGAKLCIAGNAMTSPCGEVGETSDPRTGASTTQVSNRIQLSSLDQQVPAFTVADYVRLDRPSITLFHDPDRVSLARDYAAAAEANDPVLNEWLPPSSAQAATLIELADPNANPYQSGPVLFTPLRESPDSTLELLLMPVQVAARFASPRRWIAEGLQRFLQAVSVEHRSGRKAALQFLDEYLPPVRKAEEAVDLATSTAAPGPDRTADDTLLNTSDEILLRGKSSFVFWMLRDMLGDSPLQKALAVYRPGADINPAYLQGLLEEGRKRDLEWFFDDWVYRNRGLPEFRVDNVYARPMLDHPSKVYLLTVTVKNVGGAGAEVPLLVQTPSGEKTVRVLVKARQKASERAQVPAAPARVIVNDGSVPEINSDNNTFEVPAGPAP